MSSKFVPYDPSAGKTYPPVDPDKIASIQIYPPVGVARVGDSGVDISPTGELVDDGEVEYFYGPEVPGRTDFPWGTFRDSKLRVRRQAVRFRVYAYDSAGKLLGEINASQNYQLTWTVHVANKKAAYYLYSGMYRDRKKTLRNPDVDSVDQPLSGDPFDKSLEGRSKLIVDPGPKSVTHGEGSEPVRLEAIFQGSRATPQDGVKVKLGELRTDDHGRLVFLGGTGLARSVQKTNQFYQPAIISEFDSTDWIDDICDGWVSVSVTHPNRPKLSGVAPPRLATVCSAPPKFAWGIDSPTTIYDILEDKYYKETKYEEHQRTDFYKDIWPVLMGTYKMSWANEKTFQGHGPGGFGDFCALEEKLSSTSSEYKALREHIFSKLRQPDFQNKDQAHVQLMPRLSGDNGDALEPGDIPDVPGEPIMRFAALTSVQYRRFKDWQDGNFDKGVPLGDMPAIEDYPLQDRPMLLTRATLDTTIGDPIYPGIETFWIVKYNEAWDLSRAPKDLSPPFRVNHDAILPGFLSRGLSLPWQSDFDLCNTHWWPSARPDDVVAVIDRYASFSQVTNILNNWVDGQLPTTTPQGYAVMLPHRPKSTSTTDGALLLAALPRPKWAEGLRDTPEDMSAAFFPGSTDMVHKWNKLGFVAKVPLPNTIQPVWVEGERVLPRGYQPAPPP